MNKRGSLFFVFGLLLIVLFSCFASTGTLQVTTEHPFLVNGDWISANELEIGDELTLINGSKVKITSITEKVFEDNFSVYNLEASEYSDFVVNSGDGLDVVVHNSNLPMIYDGGRVFYSRNPVEVDSIKVTDLWVSAEDPVLRGWGFPSDLSTYARTTKSGYARQNQEILLNRFKEAIAQIEIEGIRPDSLNYRMIVPVQKANVLASRFGSKPEFIYKLSTSKSDRLPFTGITQQDIHWFYIADRGLIVEPKYRIFKKHGRIGPGDYFPDFLY